MWHLHYVGRIDKQADGQWLGNKNKLTSNFLMEFGLRSSLLFIQTNWDSPFSPHSTIPTFSLVPASACEPVDTRTNQRPLLQIGFSKPLGMDSKVSIRSVDGCTSAMVRGEFYFRNNQQTISTKTYDQWYPKRGDVQSLQNCCSEESIDTHTDLDTHAPNTHTHGHALPLHTRASTRVRTHMHALAFPYNYACTNTCMHKHPLSDLLCIQHTYLARLSQQTDRQRQRKIGR